MDINGGNNLECNCNPYECQRQFDNLKNEINQIKRDKLDSKKWYEIENKMTKLESTIESLAEDRQEDKQLINNILEQINELKDTLSQLMRSDGVILNELKNIGIQMGEIKEEQKEIKKDQAQIKEDQIEIKNAKQKSSLDRFEEWMAESKSNKIKGYLVISFVAICFISMFLFYAGNGSTLFDYLEKIANIWSQIK